MPVSFPFYFLDTKPDVLFVFEVYLVDQLVLELFSIWARRLSTEALVGTRQHDVTEAA